MTLVVALSTNWIPTVSNTYIELVLPKLLTKYSANGASSVSSLAMYDTSALTVTVTDGSTKYARATSFTETSNVSDDTIVASFTGGDTFGTADTVSVIVTGILNPPST